MNRTSLSRIIAGVMTWGRWGKNGSTQQMVELINCCLAHGITTFDHADIYGDYTTEADFGKALRAGNIHRADVQLISKCGIQLPSETRKTAIKHYDYSASYIVWSVEQSLRNLQTDYLDVLLLHRPSPLMRADEIAAAIEQLQAQGKIIDFGISNFTPLQTDLIQTKIKVSYNQISFSVTHPDAMLNGSLDHMQAHGIVPMCWSPLGTVFKSDDEQARRVKKVAVGLAAQYNVPLDVLLLAWIVKHPAGIFPVCGTAEPSRIAQLMQATNIQLELQDWFALWSASMGTEVP